jgi:PAS domain S-box-containing protein
VRIEDGHAVETSQSQACETVTGYTPEEFAADPHLWFQMIAPEDREPVQERIQQVLAGQEILPLEHRLIRKDGAVRWVRDTIILFKDASGKLLGYDGVIKDITQRRQAEEEIRLLNQELEQRVRDRTAQLEAANKELEAFAYSVSHDLRAPLRHIDGFLELLQERVAANLDDHSRHYMATIADATKHMGQLIDDLLAFSRMGRYELSKRAVDLAGLVQEIIRELEPETKDRTVHWRITDLPTVSGDRTTLRLVLVNLVSNALKFTRGRTLAEIEIGCLAGEKETTIFVRDNGVGFDMAYADKLFGVFQRLHHTDEFEGTGIGLANVRRIIRRHGGRVWAEGKVDQGATFYFSLP